MQIGVSHIKIFFLWVTALVIMSHSVTPHQHHFDSVIECNHEVNQAINNTDSSPLHCHAFNILFIEKTEVSADKISIVDNVPGFIALNEIYIQCLDDKLWESIKARAKDDCLPYQFFLKDSPTRGSPFII